MCEYEAHHSSRIVYGAVNEPVLACVPSKSQRVLDLGCGSGTFGASLKQRQKCEVVGVTYSEEEADAARTRLDQVMVSDLNTFDPRALGRFDCVVCSHVLEHLFWPEQLLERLHDSFSPDGVLVVALPNIMNWKQRAAFVRGRFRYADGGLMDRTHFRFFDWETALQLVRQAGFEVTRREAGGNFPLPLLRKMAPAAAASVDKVAVRAFPNLFGWQFILVAHPRSTSAAVILANS